MTQWVDISSYEGIYQINRNGNIKALARKTREGHQRKEKVLLCSVDTDGYRVVGLTDKKGIRKTKKVARLVAVAFIKNSDNKPTVNHIDGNKENNHVENLEWATRTEQNRHALRTGLRNITGTNNKRAKFVDNDILEIRNLLLEGHYLKDIAVRFNVSISAISHIKQKRVWNHIS